MRTILIGDIEVYPNLVSVGLMGVYKEDTYNLFVLHKGKNELNKLNEYLASFNGEVDIVTHNALGYDGPILEAIRKYGRKLTNKALKRLSDKLIDRENPEFKMSDVWRELRYPENPIWRLYDTLEMTRVNQSRIGLKHAGVVMRWPKLQDLPFPPDKVLTPAEIEVVINYMKNDILVNARLFDFLENMVEIRVDTGKTYGVDVHTANDTGVGKAVLNSIYCARTGIKLQDLKEMGSPVDKVSLKECISPTIEFLTPPFKKLRKQIEAITVYEENDFKYIKYFTHDGVTYKLGVGGLHTEDGQKPGIFKTTAINLIRDADGQSFYPNIMIENMYYPPHLGEVFIDILRDTTQERLKAKALGNNGDKYQANKASSLKITINSIYGLLGNKYYWLYSPKTLISVTITGQLLLLDLVEKLSMIGVPTISANTDGIVCDIPVELEAKYYAACEEWEKRTGIKLDYTDYAVYARRDVNNYITIKPNGAAKTKGVFGGTFMGWEDRFYDMYLYDDWVKGETPDEATLKKFRGMPNLTKGFDKPVVTYALYQYFVRGVPIETTIRKHPSIYDFCIAQRADTDKFDILLKVVDNEGEIVDTEQQKTNRYIVTLDGGALTKNSKTTTQTWSMVKQAVTLLNDVTDPNAHNYNLDYNYYIKEANKILHKIIPPVKSMGLFD